MDKRTKEALEQLKVLRKLINPRKPRLRDPVYEFPGQMREVKQAIRLLIKVVISRAK